MTEIFEEFCKICNKITPHVISKLRIRKGVKICCIACKTESKKYLNINKLNKVMIENEQ